MTGTLYGLVYGHYDARHEALAIDRVMAYGQRLPQRAENKLVVCHAPRHAPAVDADALVNSSSSTGDDLLFGLRRGERGAFTRDRCLGYSERRT